MPRIKLVPVSPPANVYVGSSCISPEHHNGPLPGQYVYYPADDGYPASWSMATEVPDEQVDIANLQDEAELLESRLHEIYKQLGRV